MSTSKKKELIESFLNHIRSKSSGGSNGPTLSAFCDWIRQQSIKLPSDEYLTGISGALLDLCVEIKISKSVSNEQCRKMAGNLYLFSQVLSDAMEDWKVVVSEKEAREKREQVRDTQDKLIDALKKFDDLCSWAEFEKWLSSQNGSSINSGAKARTDEVKGKIDFAIITMRPDEFEAVLQRFPPQDYLSDRRYYSISRVDAADQRSYRVAVARTNFQGTGEAQDIARDIIADLDPKWILVTGIAGGVPSTEFTLGDVVLSTKIYDVTLKAVIEGRPDEYAIGGGSGKKSVTNLVSFLPAMKSRLAGWNEMPSIGLAHPHVPLQGKALNTYGDRQWKQKVRDSLKHHFDSSTSPRKPLFTSGTIISSDTLVKDTKTIIGWLQVMRDALAVEMEAAGIYRAARSGDKEYPFLAIRGISDIVGLKRHQDWTTYACHSAAAFTLAFVKGGFI